MLAHVQAGVATALDVRMQVQVKVRMQAKTNARALTLPRDCQVGVRWAQGICMHLCCTDIGCLGCVGCVGCVGGIGEASMVSWSEQDSTLGACGGHGRWSEYNELRPRHAARRTAQRAGRHAARRTAQRAGRHAGRHAAAERAAERAARRAACRVRNQHYPATSAQRVQRARREVPLVRTGTQCRRMLPS